MDNGRLSFEEEQVLNKDINDFLKDIYQLDSKLSSGASQDDEKSIFTSRQEG